MIPKQQALADIAFMRGFRSLHREYLSSFDTYESILQGTYQSAANSTETETRKLILQLKEEFQDRRQHIANDLPRAESIAKAFDIQSSLAVLLKAPSDKPFVRAMPEESRLHIIGTVDQAIGALETESNISSWSRGKYRTKSVLDWLQKTGYLKYIVIAILVVIVALILKLLGFDLKLVLDIIRELKK